MSGQTPLPSTPVDLPLLPLRDVVVFPHINVLTQAFTRQVGIDARYKF